MRKRNGFTIIELLVTIAIITNNIIFWLVFHFDQSPSGGIDLHRKCDDLK